MDLLVICIFVFTLWMHHIFQFHHIYIYIYIYNYNKIKKNSSLLLQVSHCSRSSGNWVGFRWTSGFCDRWRCHGAWETRWLIDFFLSSGELLKYKIYFGDDILRLIPIVCSKGFLFCFHDGEFFFSSFSSKSITRSNQYNHSHRYHCIVNTLISITPSLSLCNTAVCLSQFQHHPTINMFVGL